MEMQWDSSAVTCGLLLLELRLKNTECMHCILCDRSFVVGIWTLPDLSNFKKKYTNWSECGGIILLGDNANRGAVMRSGSIVLDFGLQVYCLVYIYM